MFSYEETPFETPAIRIAAVDENGKECGRVYLYILKNSLHPEPYGFVEDLFVEERVRSHGVGSALFERAVALAHEKGCYKILGTSRMDRPLVHAWYEKRGFYKRGIEFRQDVFPPHDLKPDTLSS